VAFSPDGQALAAVAQKQGAPVKLWDLASGKVRARLKGHAGWPRAAAFSPDGILATASVVPRDPRHWENAPGEIRLWDGGTGRPLGEPWTCARGPNVVAFGGHGQVLAVWQVRGRGETGLTVWDLRLRRGPAP